MLVDEFQDTDPVQWDIMRRAFGEGGVTLVLIGDPKQAIYAFRGADVYAYLEAARQAGDAGDARRQLAQRPGAASTPTTRCFGGAKLGHEGIVYRQVRAADANQTPRLTGAPVDGAAAHPGGRPRRAGDQAHTQAAARATPPRASTSPTTSPPTSRGCSPPTPRSRSAPRTARRRRRERVRPGHVAVLVRTHRNAALIRDALDEVDIPAVINGAGSVFGTAPARDWLRLLEAIERPVVAARAPPRPR